MEWNGPLLGARIPGFKSLRHLVSLGDLGPTAHLPEPQLVCVGWAHSASHHGHWVSLSSLGRGRTARACPYTLGVCGVPACRPPRGHPRRLGPCQPREPGTMGKSWPQARTVLCCPPTSPPTEGPHPPWPLSDSQRCTPPTPAPAVGTHTAPATAGQPGLASSYSPLGGLLRTPVEGRPCAEAGAAGVGGGPVPPPQRQRGWRSARGLPRGQPGLGRGPGENQTIPTPGGHTNPVQAKPHVLPVTQGPRWAGAGIGQPPLASKVTEFQAHPTASAGGSPRGEGGE